METPRAVNLTIGPDGAAGISGVVAMNIASVRAAAHGFEAAEAPDQIDGEHHIKIVLSRDGAAIFEILPAADHAHIGAIITHSPEVRGPHGDVIGRSTFGEAPAMEALFCRAREAHEDFSFTCSSSSAGRFWRAYRLASSYRGPASPFERIDPNAAIAARLVEMKWIAPG